MIRPEIYIQNIRLLASLGNAAQIEALSADQSSTAITGGPHRTEPFTNFVVAYNFKHRLKTLNGLTPFEYICKIGTSQPKGFILNPVQQMPGLNI